MNKSILSNDPCQYPVQIPKIPRQAVVDNLFQLLQQNHEVLLYGPAHWGKSYLVEHNIPEDLRFKSEYDSILLLNLFTLRIPESNILERESVRWLIKNPDKFDQFMESSNEKKLLQKYLLDFFNEMKGLLIIDHCELLPETNSIKAWVKSFHQFLSKNNIDVIWVDHALSPKQSRISQWTGEIKSTLEPPSISERELEEWLSSFEMGHLTYAVFKATGGIIMLVRDFFVYAITRCSSFQL